MIINMKMFDIVIIYQLHHVFKLLLADEVTFCSNIFTVHNLVIPHCDEMGQIEACSSVLEVGRRVIS